MQEQVAVMKQLNSFLERRGLRANFLAQQVGISEASLYYKDMETDSFMRMPHFLVLKWP